MRFLIAIAVLGTPALAQSASDIVVTGQRLSKEEVREQARSFVRGVSATPVSGQFARWREPICAKTIGLAPDNAALVTEKIREIARAANMRLAKPKCVTNLLIVFTDNADRDVAALRKQGGGRVFGKYDPVETRLLAEGGRPVRWWYKTAIEGRYGHQPSGTPGALLGAQIEGAGGGQGINSNGEAAAVDGYSSSLVGTHIRAKIEQATFIVDANAASGRTLKSVAAYAALVTLARIRMDGAIAAEDSILRLFSLDEPKPTDLTARDRVFLAALYQVPANRDARQQERQIAVVMSKLLTGE